MSLNTISIHRHSFRLARLIESSSIMNQTRGESTSSDKHTKKRRVIDCLRLMGAVPSLQQGPRTILCRATESLGAESRDLDVAFGCARQPIAAVKRGSDPGLDGGGDAVGSRASWIFSVCFSLAHARRQSAVVVAASRCDSSH